MAVEDKYYVVVVTDDDVEVSGYSAYDEMLLAYQHAQDVLKVSHVYAFKGQRLMPTFKTELIGIVEIDGEKKEVNLDRLFAPAEKEETDGSADDNASREGESA